MNLQECTSMPITSPSHALSSSVMRHLRLSFVSSWPFSNVSVRPCSCAVLVLPIWCFSECSFKVLSASLAQHGVLRSCRISVFFFGLEDLNQSKSIKIQARPGKRGIHFDHLVSPQDLPSCQVSCAFSSILRSLQPADSHKQNPTKLCTYLV